MPVAVLLAASSPVLISFGTCNSFSQLFQHTETSSARDNRIPEDRPGDCVFVVWDWSSSQCDTTC